MKKTVNVAIGGCSFIIDEDACNTLSTYLDRFKAALGNDSSSNDVMDELESRISDLLKSKLGAREVVNLKMVDDVIEQLGYPEGYDKRAQEDTSTCCQQGPVKKLFRDPDEKKIAGVCSGLALYLNIDPTLIRVIFLVAFICGLAGLWIYVVIWIAAPMAKTAVEKCELRGIPATAENIKKYTQGF